jgi:hypothetical protein
VREILVIAALARTGALSPLPAVLYAIAYPALNLTLFLCNYHRVPLPLALKSYLVVYPALFAHLWLGVNWLDGAASLSIGLMGFGRRVGAVASAAASVMANIAEGFDAGSDAEFIRFLGYARRSASEVQSHLYIALD